MKLDPNRPERRVPKVVLYLAGTMIVCPFLLLTFALSPSGVPWLKFVVPALTLIVLPVLWRRFRRPRSGGLSIPVSVLAQQVYPPGA